MLTTTASDMLHVNVKQKLDNLYYGEGSAIKVLVAIHYSVLDARNGYIRNVVV